MWKRVISKVGSRKAILVVGPRQVGKTTLIKNELSGIDYQFFDVDDPTVRKILSTPNTENIRRLIGNKKTVFIDKGQPLGYL